MIEVRVDTIGMEGFAEGLLDELRPRAEVAVRDGSILLEAQVKQTLTGRRHGRPYKASKTGRLHIASAPGEPPAVLYGRLRNSIAHRPPTWDGDTVEAETGTNVVYARRLEEGGRDSRGVFIAARPYFRPGLEQARPSIERRLEQL